MSRRFSYWFFGVIAAWLTYGAVWTWLSLERVYLLRATVFDLGIYSQWAWQIYATPLTSSEWLGTALNFGATIFLSPTSFGGYSVILAEQSFVLGSGAVLLYLISREYRLRPSAAFGLSLTYLLYFPLSGINFTDAHYESFLIPFFLLGVWLYLRGSFTLSMLFFLLAGAIRYPFPIFPLIFGLQTLVPQVSRTAEKRLGTSSSENSSSYSVASLLRAVAGWRLTGFGGEAPRWYAWGLPLASAALFVGGWLTNNLYAPNHSVAALVHASSLEILPNFPIKIWSLFLLLAPLAFLPMLSPRWLTFCLPFFGLMFFVNYFGYTYPFIATSWYTIIVVPFLLLGTTDGVAKIQQGTSWIHALVRRVRGALSREVGPGAQSAQEPVVPADVPWKARAWRKFRKEVGQPETVAVTSAVVLTVIAAGFLAPYGPWNSSTSASFHFSAFGSTNMTLYQEFLHLTSFIPRTDPLVLMQDNMPELLPRPLFPGERLPFAVGPFPIVAYNFTWHAPNGSWVPINPDYVIADPSSSAYNFFDASGSYPFNISMEQAISVLYATYDYGIVGEASNMLLLKHYYSGPLLYYVPYSAQFPASTFTSDAGNLGSSICGKDCLVVSNLTNLETAWYGPYTYLSPGTYAVSIHLGLENWAPSDSALIQVTGEFGRLLLNSTRISGITVGPRLTSMYLNSTVFVGNGTRAVEFGASESDFHGSLAIYGASVHEIAPPSTIYRVGNTSRDAAIYHLLGLVPQGSSVLAEPALKPYFHNLSLVPAPSTGPGPAVPYELYDPAVPSECGSGPISTVCTVVNDSYASGNYSIVAQADGVTLLARSSASSLTLFSPFEENISASQLSTQGTPGQDYTNQSGDNLTVTNQTNGAYGWYGPYADLPPGTYDTTFELSASNNSPQNHLTLGVIANDGTVVVASKEISGSTFPRAGQVVDVTLPGTLFSFSSSVEFVGYGVDWSGVLTVHGITVRQVGPPSPVYRVGNTLHDLSVYRLLGLIPNGSTVLADPALRPYFHNLTLVSVPPGGPAPSAPYELYDPAFPSECTAPGNSTLCAAVNNSYSSGAYSIMAQADGVTLLVRSPAASLEAYTPLQENITTSELIIEGAAGQDFTTRSGSNLTVTNQTNGAYAWFGPYASLPPGTYNATFQLSVTNNSPLNHMQLRVSGEAGHVLFATLNLTGSEFAQTGETVEVNLSFVLTSFSSSIEFVGCEVDWTGVITLAGIPLLETTAPA